jgi:hypothetical protein
MTPEDWKNVEDALSSPYGSVNLKIDGYDITIMCVVEKPLHYCLAVYVDGKIKGEWISQDCEIRRKFYQKHTLDSKQKKRLKREKKEETFDVAILTVENSIDEIRLINENSQNSFDNQFDKLILKYLLKYVQVNKTKFNCVHDLYDILNNQNFQEYVMKRINDKWTCIHQRIISLTILFQELTGMIYKASSEN